MMKPPDKFRYGKLLKPHEMTGVDILEIDAMRIFNRYAQCRGTDSVLRTLAHLLAAHSRATPKQAKEPIVA